MEKATKLSNAYKKKFSEFLLISLYLLGEPLVPHSIYELAQVEDERQSSNLGTTRSEKNDFKDLEPDQLLSEGFWLVLRLTSRTLRMFINLTSGSGTKVPLLLWLTEASALSSLYGRTKMGACHLPCSVVDLSISIVPFWGYHFGAGEILPFMPRIPFMNELGSS
jgi:hypothetical protein